MFLIKSGEKENLLQLQNDGRIYMKSLSYFEQCEDLSRKDDLEKASFVINNPPEPYYLKIKRDNVEGDHLTFKINKSITKGYEGYIFCMHCIMMDDSEEEKSFQLSTKDDHILIINGNQFLNVIEQKLLKDKINHNKGLVIYKDFTNYVGRKNPFEKDLKFKGEHEFRLFIPMKENKEFHDFYIGALNEFSALENVSPNHSFKIQREIPTHTTKIKYI